MSENKETKDKDESKAEEPQVVEEQGNIHEQVQSLIDDGMNEEDTKEKIDTLKGILALLETNEERDVICKMSDDVAEINSTQGMNTGDQVENFVPDNTVKLSSVNYTVQLRAEKDSEQIETSEVDKVVHKFIDDNSDKKTVKVLEESKEEQQIVSEMQESGKTDRTEEGEVKIKEIESNGGSLKDDTVSDIQESELQELEKPVVEDSGEMRETKQTEDSVDMRVRKQNR